MNNNQNHNKTHKRPGLNAPAKLVEWAGTRDPVVIAGMLDISVFHLQHPESGLPGLTCMYANHPAVFINDAYFDRLMETDPSYTEEIRKADITQVTAHELGHACLHRRELRQAPIMERQLFDLHARMEIEANHFAAQILIPTDEMLALLHSGLDVLQAAKALRVNVNLLLCRIKMLQDDGIPCNNLPYIPEAGFLGYIHAAGSPEWENR